MKSTARVAAPSRGMSPDTIADVASSLVNGSRLERLIRAAYAQGWSDLLSVQADIVDGRIAVMPGVDDVGLGAMLDDFAVTVGRIVTRERDDRRAEDIAAIEGIRVTDRRRGTQSARSAKRLLRSE